MAPRKYGSFSDCRINANGGFYLRGEGYCMAKKIEIALIFFDRWADTFPKKPNMSEIARDTRVTHTTVRRIIEEFEREGRIVDPKEKKWEKAYIKSMARSIYARLTHDEESFLMSLHAEDPLRPNESYVDELNKKFNKKVSSPFITRWFKKRYEHDGNFVKAIMVPCDKFKQSNWYKYFEYRLMLDLVSNHNVFNFVDEKHIYNHNGHHPRVRRNPITGEIPHIKVSGNFRDSQSIIAAITTNKQKDQKVFFTMGRNNNDSESFMEFIRMMVGCRFLLHQEVVIMDNCAIHRGGAASNLQDFLWNFVVDGEPLRVLVLFLPPRAPELNPIELVFHILNRRMKSFKYRKQGPLCEDLVERVTTVMNDIGDDHDLILRCCKHCGYDVDVHGEDSDDGTGHCGDGVDVNGKDSDDCADHDNDRANNVSYE